MFNGRKVGFMNINEKIKRLREGKHWSQEEMAQKLNMSKNGYAKIERGETSASFGAFGASGGGFGHRFVRIVGGCVRRPQCG